MSRCVEVGILPTRSRGGTREWLGRVADAGIDHVVVGDHVSFRNGSGTDGLIQAALYSGLHPRLPVHVGVYQLPLRHPMLVARQVASLSALAPGRLVLGVGVGGEDRHEATVCGVDPATRGRRMDESLDLLHRLLAGETVTAHGEFFSLDRAVIRPAPDPAVPVLIGGRSQKALSRTAAAGDGWLAVWVSPERFAAAVKQIGTEAAQAGRGRVHWRHGLQLWCGIGASDHAARPRLAAAMERFYGLPFAKFARYSPCGTPEDVAAFLRPYIEAGCGHVNLAAVGGDPESEIAGVARIRALLAGGNRHPEESRPREAHLTHP
ncbi:LLM class flavin-dependent oxidoreductase [Nonomuraea sp. NPDC046802]|uniref:LLM class flavin-dependent oxidoreductase n=1 Tax=Nonomuraea sp. NPDC046802 TaxID=3154919 RepID=UPI0033D9BCF9